MRQVARHYDIYAPLPQAWRSAAIRRGTFHAADGHVLLGLGDPVAVPLPALSSGQTSAAVAEVLAGIEFLEGAGLRSPPRIHAALPFHPDAPGIGYLSPIQVHADADGLLVTLIGHDLDELDRLDEALESLSEADPPVVLPTLVALEQVPSTSRYEQMVRTALEQMGHCGLDKVVLSRSVVIDADADLDPVAVIDRMLEREPTCTLFSLPASGARFVGASPELLIMRRGRQIRSHPLAGTIARTEDDLTGLVQSLKNSEEHRLVVEDLATRLHGLVEHLEVPLTPEVVTLRAVCHLGTEISGVIRSGGPTALDLLAAIHPTPAIGGVPTRRAVDLIGELEPSDRGLFGGAVGWADKAGDGDWVLGIRGALLAGSTAVVRAGAGIVRGSEPSDEARETRIKLLSILDALAPGCAALL